MKIFSTIKYVAACVALAGANASFSHITLDEALPAVAGSNYKAAFRVGHACAGARSTTGIVVRIPPGFQQAQPVPKAGWTLSLQRAPAAAGSAGPGPVTEVRWTAATPEAALATAYYDEFVLRGRLPATAGPLWFPVQQICDQGSADWAEVPASGTSTKGLKSPAALLLVRAAATSPADDVAQQHGGMHMH